MTVVGTRPELIKMSLVIEKLDELCDHVLVHTGQNFDYELNDIFFKDLGIRTPDHFLGVAGQSPAETIARIIAESDKIFEREAPEAVLIYGDTNSGLCVIPAKRRKIPVFHMEAGNRCFDQRVPEELNRKVIDHLSDVNLVLTEHARRYLLAEGLPADRIFKVGSHMAEVLDRQREKIQGSRILDELGLQPERYFLVSAHREENVDSASRIRALLDSLNALAEEYGYPVITSTHPRTRQRLSGLGESAALSPLVRFLPAFGFTDYVRLQLGAYCVLSDSGTIAEESSLLDLPAVTMREAHERPEGMDAGTLVMSGIERQEILDAVRVVRAGYRKRRFAGSVPDYEGGEVATKVARIVMSYIDFVNRVVWSKRRPDHRQSFPGVDSGPGLAQTSQSGC
jgi:UDP-N-acetylglucosamine 2-epimerase